MIVRWWYRIRLWTGLIGLTVLLGCIYPAAGVFASGGEGVPMAGIAVLLEDAKEVALSEEVYGENYGTSREPGRITAGEAAIYDDAEKEKAENKGSKDTAEGSLVMTNVNYILNVRKEPDETSEKAGYLYADCGGTILEHKDGWTKLRSGELTGWAKDEFLLFGKEAMEEAKQVGRTVATVDGNALRIRREPAEDAGVYALAGRGETFELLGDGELEFSDGIKLSEEWAAVDYEGETGYVYSEYISVDFKVDTGETLEKVLARQEAAKKAEEAANQKTSRNSNKPVKQNMGAIPASVDDSVLLAALIQCEAGGEMYEGQVAVGAVVMNRVRSGSYPNNIREVIYASGQFTPVSSGRLAEVLASGNIRPSCVQAANEAIAGANNVGGSTHFRRAGNRDGLIIGHHVFW